VNKIEEDGRNSRVTTSIYRLLTETDLDGYRAFFAEYPAL